MTDDIAQIHEEVSEFLDELAEDERETEESYRRDPKAVLEVLKRAVQEHNRDATKRLPVPVEVTEVLEVQVKCGLRKTSTLFRAKATRKVRGAGVVEDVIEYTTWSTGGSMYEPPDGESDVFWENLDGNGKTITWEHLYTIRLPDRAPDVDTTLRANKVEYLYRVLRAASVRVRIHSLRLECASNQVKDAYAALGRHLLHLDAGKGVFNGVFPA